MSTWLITGCSTGLGRALAEAVIATDHNAVVTARDAGRVADLAERNTDRVLALPLDVTDSAQVTNAARQAEEKFGDIDVLVNNAAASEVQIRVSRGMSLVTATVVDNGVGGVDLSHGSGLAGIRDRVEAIGGSLTLAERAGGGTVVTVTLALPAAAEQ